MPVNKKNRIGYRYLFDSKGCSLKTGDEFSTEFVVGKKYGVQVYFGRRPKYGFKVISNAAKYYVPGTTVFLGTTEFKSELDENASYGPYFLEISVTTDVADELSGLDILLKEANARKSEFESIINLVAGAIGLRFHRQFVLEVFNENALAWEGDTSFHGNAGPVFELLEPLQLNENGIKYFNNLKDVFTNLQPEAISRMSLVFHWLLRAWYERDNLYSFIAFFIPLECVLSNWIEVEEDGGSKQCADAIRKLLQEHGGKNSVELCQYFNNVCRNSGPTIDERFVKLATMAKMPGWQTDIEAFRKFKRMRNVLLHGAGTCVEQRLSIGQEELRTLSDLVERYVNCVLFWDNNVYRSRYRPQIGENSAKG
jgi:hypothetical protein